MNQARYLLFVKKFVFTICVLTSFVVFSQTTVPFQPRYQNTINGELTMIGNNVVGNHVTNPFNNTDVTDSNSQNNNINMVYVDVDSDASTFNSSSATLNLPTCSKIVYAGLYWGAVVAPATPPPPAPESAPNEVKFRTPTGAYVDIVADISNPLLREELDRVYYHDVTSLINIANPNGEYFVANVNTGEGNHQSAGWTLVVVYEDPAAPRRYISTFDGFSAVRSFPNNVVDFNYSGFTTPPSGPVEGKLGVVAMEGDLALYGDHFQLRANANTDPINPNANFTNLYDDNQSGPGDSDPTDGVNNADNFFNSSVTDSGAVVGTRNPASANTLGWDQHIVDLTPLNGGNTLIGNGETGLTARVTNDVGGDHIFTFLNTLSINVIEPTLQVLTTVEDVIGNPVTATTPVTLGDRVWYNLNLRNIGTDNAISTTVINTLPINVTLDESTFSLPAGVSYSTTVNGSGRTVITFTIDNGLLPKGMLPTDPGLDIRYQVITSNQCDDYTDKCTNELRNELESNYTGEDSGQVINAQPGLNGINGCGVPNEGAMLSYVDISSCLVGSSETVCNDTTLLSSDSGYNAWRWYNAVGDLVGTDETLTITPQSGQTTYRCEQIKIGCTIRDKIFTVLGLDVEYTPFDSLCKGSDNGGVTIKVNEASTTYKYQLFGPVPGDTGDVTSDTHTFNNLKPGSYSVRVTKAEGCFDIHTFTIDEPTELKASNVVTDNIMPCNGNRLEGRIEVTGSGGTQITGTADGNIYEYSMDGGAFQTSNVFETAVEGNHTMTVKDANGCTTTTIANISFDDEIEYEITKEDVVCLNGNNGIITANVTQNNSGNTITYSIDGGPFQTSPTFSNLTVGDYEITIRKEKGANTCEIKETVSLVQLVDLAFTAESSFSCAPVGGINTITATVADEYKDKVRYRLNGGSENTTGIFENVSAGLNTITVLATVQELGKTFTCAAEPIEITIDSYTPVTVTDIENSDPNDENRYRIVYTDGEGTLTYALQFLSKDEVTDLSGVTIKDEWFQEENQFDIRRTGYYVALVRDGRGCDRFIIKFLEFKDIQIPNFFTPNRDGTNDTWYPTYIDKYPNISVQIFDRHQRMLSEHFGINESWNGEYKGKLLPSGDYWYIIRLNDTEDNRVFKGHFTLYR